MGQREHSPEKLLERKSHSEEVLNGCQKVYQLNLATGLLQTAICRHAALSPGSLNVKVEDMKSA